MKYDSVVTSHLIGVDRAGLSKEAFKSPESITVLRSIISPSIKKLLLQKFEEIDQSGDYDIIAVEGATIVESSTYKFFDELWVLTLDKESAFKRVKQRNPELSD